jgi:predicted outer membrane repeat protein
LTLVNGNSGYGAAIYNQGELIIGDCDFTSNVASMGGAIYNEGTLDIDDCTFTNNAATYKGGAIYNNGGSVEVTDSNFNGNDITKRNGAASDDNGGAAIFNLGGSLTVDNSKVLNSIKDYVYEKADGSTGDYIDGAITSSGSTVILNSEFDKNSGRFGADICVLPINTGDVASLTVDNCNFTNAVSYAGGVHIEHAKVDISNSRFENYVAGGAGSPGYSAAGGVICAMYSGTEMSIVNCTFNNNSAPKGGAILAQKVTNVTIVNSNFTNNIATGTGTSKTKGYGGAVLIEQATDSSSIDGCVFTGNEGVFGGAIGIDLNNVEVKNSNFTYNTAANDGGAIYAGADAVTSVEDSTFMMNTAVGGNGSAIYNKGKLTLSDNLINQGSADIYSVGGTISPINITVTINGLESYLYVVDETVTLNATVTDVDGNLVDIDNLVFKLTNGDHVESIAATYVGNGKYSAAINPVDDLNYVVSVAFTAATDVQYNIKTANLITIKGSFRDLKSQVGNATSGELTLNYDFAYVPGVDDQINYPFENGIIINGPLTINGNGHSICGSDAVRIFNVATGTLTLNNVTLSHGNASQGGAVYVASGAELDANYVTFNNNTATYKGGAIYSEGAVKVNHTVFDSNNITKNDGDYTKYYGGAAIFNGDGTLTVDNSLFKNNLKDYIMGVGGDNGDKLYGAITATGTVGTVKITNSNFTANKGRWGSSISIENIPNNVVSITIDNCNFTDNLAYQGGAIHITDVNAELNINNCWFENNNAKGIGSTGYVATGGAVVISLDYVSPKAVINGTTFINNHVSDSGSNPDMAAGALYFLGNELTIEDSSFIANTAEGRGGAFYIYDTKVDIDNVTFESNSAINGGAIYADNNANVKNSRFIDNTATENGGAIYFSKWCPDSSVTESNFTGNNAGVGNAIYNVGILTLSHNNVSSTQADIVSDGTVSSEINVVILPDGPYTYHFAKITLQANVTDDNHNPMILADLNLTVNDTANTQVKVTYNPATGLHEGTYTPIEVGKFNIGATYTTTSQLYITTANITIAKSLIDIQNMIDAASAGDTITLEGDYAYIEELDSSIKTGIVVDKTLTIDGKGSTISGSNAAGILNVNCDGLTIKNTTFINASAQYGAICAYMGNTGSESVLAIENCHFANNTGQYSGAIHAQACILNVTNSTFEQNKALYGGAIYVYKAGLIADNCTFTENQAINMAGKKSMGGAILAAGKNAVAIITNSVFTKNTAQGTGGAVAINPNVDNVGSSLIDNCTFEDNVALTGGAVYVSTDTNLTINDSRFTRNIANNGVGGAIYIVKGNTTVTGSNFTDNSATFYGGAIVVSPYGDCLEVNDSRFDGNTANNTANSISQYAGELKLARNTIVGDEAEIIVSGGKIISTIKVIVLDGEVKTIDTLEANLYAKVTDDTGINLIKDAQFKFTINDEEVPAVYDNGLYKVTYPLPSAGIYPVNITYVTDDKNLEVQNGTIRCIKGTFTELASLVAGTGATLQSNFAYVPEIDGETYINGIVIDHDVVIDGNGTIISGNNAARIFNVANGATLTLSNATLTNGNATNGSAINSNGNLELNGVTFSDNVAVDCGGAIYNNKGTVIIEDCVFDKNDLTNRKDGYTKDYGGAAIYSVGGTLKINGSKFTNNLLNYYPGVNDATRDKVTAAITSSGVTVVNNTAFENNSGTYGADLMVYKSSKITDPASLTIDNSNFTNTRSYAGGIQIAKIDFNITNSNFDKNIAYGVGSTGYTAAGGAIDARDCNDGIIKDSNFTNCGNTQGGAVNIQNTKSLLIDGCIFENNTVSSYGGAVCIIKPNGDVTITNTDFINNTANNAGAVYYWTVSDNKLTISDCEFKDNYARDTGAAVYTVMNPEGNLDIINSNFTNNNAVKRAGAVFFGTTGSDNELTISNSKFTDNGAATGEAIYTFAKTVTKITDSTFTNNGEATDYTIYNKGTLELTRTTVDNLVYSSGTFNTELNATFLNNKTWNDTGLGDIYILNATLTDKNGNKIYDPNFRFAVNRENITDILYNKTTGLYTTSYLITTAGLKVISTNYQAAGLVIYPGALDIELANVTNFTVDVEDTLEGDNATVLITLIGTHDIGLNATVTVYISGVKYTVDVQNGTGMKSVEGLVRGLYPVTAFFDDNPNYNKEVNSTAFYVKGNSTLTVNDVVANYSDVIEVTIKLTDGNDNPLTGIVVIEEEFEVLVQNGTGVWTIDIQPGIGVLNYNAVYNGTNDFFGSQDGFSITINQKVIDPSEVKVEIPEENELGENITVTITSPVDGEYKVTIDGTDMVVPVTVVNGTGSANITGLDAGSYNATVQSADGNYTIKEPVKVGEFYNYITPEFTIDISGTYPNATIKINGTPGTYHVSIPGFDVPDIIITGTETVTVPINDIDSGIYTASIEFEKTGNYYGLNVTDYKFFIDKADTILKADAVTTAKFGDKIEVTINLTDTNGNPLTAIVVVNETFNVLVNNGVGVFLIDNQPDVGEYTFVAVSAGDNNYNNNSAEFKVNVITHVIDPKDVNVTIPTINEYPNNITVTITSPVDGKYTVNVNGTIFTVEVVNGTGSANITGLAAGIYNANVTINETGYSLETITTDVFDYLVTPEINVFITGTYPSGLIMILGPLGEYHVTILETMEKYDINNTLGGASEVINNISSGKYTAHVKFDANGIYRSNEQTVDFTINKATLNINPTVVGDKVFGSSINITFTLPIHVNSSYVHAFLDGVAVQELSVNETTGVYTLGPLRFDDASGHLFTVDVNDPNYYEDTGSVSFTIEKAAPSLTVGNASTDWNVPVDISVKLTGVDDTPIAGYVTVTVSWVVSGVEKIIKLDTNGQGVANFVITEAIGDLNITATFEGNENYNATESKATLKVKQVNINPNDVNVTLTGDYPDGVITVESPVDGNYEVRIGEEVLTVEVKGGNGSTVVGDLAAGEYDATVSILNGYYNLTKEVPLAYYKNPNFNVSIGGTYPTGVIVINGPLGNYHVTIFLNETDTLKYDILHMGMAIQLIDHIDSGNYTAFVTFDGNGIYRYDEQYVNFTIYKAASEVTITEPIDDVAYGTTAEIFYTGDNLTEVSAVIMDAQGNTYTCVVGSYIISVGNLPVGTYMVYVSNKGDNNHNESFDVSMFNVVRAEPTIVINVLTVVNTYPGAVSFYVLGPDGSYLISVDGKEIPVQIVDFYSGNITIEELSAGEKTLYVEFDGNENYTNGTNSTTFEIFAQYIDPDDVTVTLTGDYPDGVITVLAPVDGIYNLAFEEVDLVIPVEVEDCVGIADIGDLIAGNYTASVSIFDDNYSLTKEVELAYYENPNFNVSIGGTYPTGEIMIQGPSGNYSVIIWETLKQYDMSILDMGLVFGPIPDDIDSGNYSATIIFYGNGVYRYDEQTVNFTIDKADSDVTIIEPIDTVAYGSTAVIYYAVENKTDLFVSIVDLDGNSYSCDIEDDCIVADGLPAGRYTVNIYNAGDENYAESEDSAVFEVVKAKALDIEIINQTTVGIATTFGVNITVGPNATGKVYINRNGYLEEQELLEGGYYYFEDVAVNEDIYRIDVSYLGDDNYEAAFEFQVVESIYTNVVTNDTFFGYFDEDGVLLDDVEFDELIFSGNFTGLGVDLITINRPIEIYGEGETGYAMFYNMGLRVEADDVSVSNLMFVNLGKDFSQINDGASIYVKGEDVTIEDIGLVHGASQNNSTYGIYVADGSNGFELSSSVIQFMGDKDKNVTDYQVALRVSGSDDVFISKNRIYAALPARTPDWYGVGIDKDYVLAVGIQNGDDIIFYSNDVTVYVIGENSYKTVDAVMVDNVVNLEISRNNITLTDDFNDGVAYYYALDLYGVDGAVIRNNITVDTATGAVGSGAAYDIQINGPSKVVVSYNNLTAISNGPTAGIMTSWYNGAVDLTVEFNDIDVTGSTGLSNYALTTGIELQVEAKVYNNTIHVTNIGEYDDDNYIFGISAAQDSYLDFSVDIKDNEIYSDGMYAVYVKNTENGEVSGNYLIANELQGDDAVYANDDVIVEDNFPADLELYVSADDIMVDDPVIIEVSTNSLFTGMVTVLLDKEYYVAIIDGEGTLELDSLPYGNYTVTAYYEGDKYFYEDQDEDTFEVSRYVPEINITTGDIVVDQDLEVNVSLSDVNGKLYVVVDGNADTLYLIDGNASFIIPRANMTAGDHNIVVVFGGDSFYESIMFNMNFTVEKAEGYTFDVNLTIDEITIGDDVTFNVTLPEDANGVINVSVDGEPVTYEPVVNGTATVTVPASAFTAGEYNSIEVTYSDDKYGETTVEKELYVEKLDADLSATADDISIGEDAVIVVSIPGAPDDTSVTVELLGEFYTLYLEDGQDEISIPGLSEGTYTAYVYIEDDPIYDDEEVIVTFSVTKVVIPAEDAFNITTPENATAPVFTVKLPEDATGYLLLDINGTQTFVPLVNGTATARVPEGFAPGNYTATVTYTGDDKYDPVTTTQNITVTSNVPDNAFTIPDTAKDGEPLTYAINLPSDAKGYLEVDVDGTKHVVALVNGSASITVPGLSQGSHNVTVSYTGDGKYSPVTKSMTMNIPAPVYKITNNNNVAAIYSANANYKVLITKDGKAVGAGESVVITFNGKKTTVKTDSKGYATLKLNTKVKVKTYTVTAEYKGVKVTNKVTVKHVIKAKNVSVKKSKKVNKIKVKTNKVNGKFLKGKKLTLKLKGKKIKAKINKKGVATFKVKKNVLKKLKVGKKYKFTVTYGKDKVTKKVKVKR